MAIWVPAFLIAQALLWAALVASFRSRNAARRAVAATSPTLRFLVHAINEDRCTGCETCITACPTRTLELVDHKSRVARFDQCVQCEKCARVCPTQALVMHLEGSTPPPIRVPDIDKNLQTAVPGQYLIGEVAGKPLVKNAANLGRLVIEHVASTGLKPTVFGGFGSDKVDVAIVGSGPAGLSAALTCVYHGYSYVLLEKEQVMASTISRYPNGKPFMAEPTTCRNVSFLPVFDTSKEQLLATWKQLVDAGKVAVRLGESVEKVARRDDGQFDVTTTVASYRAHRVVLATGVRGKPRTLGVPGENLPKVHSMLEEPSVHAGHEVLVVGGGDTALESALALSDAGARVTVSYRKKSFSRANKKNVAAVARLASAGGLEVVFESQVAGIETESVTLSLPGGGTREIANEACFVLIGADLPVKWLGKVGVEFVQRPHSHELGASDALVEAIAGDCADCPTDAVGALARIRRQPIAADAAPTRVLGGEPRRESTLGSFCRRLRRAASNRLTELRERSSITGLRELRERSAVTNTLRRPRFRDTTAVSTIETSVSPRSGFEDDATIVDFAPGFILPTPGEWIEETFP